MDLAERTHRVARDLLSLAQHRHDESRVAEQRGHTGNAMSDYSAPRLNNESLGGRFRHENDTAS
ncbi:hypothetical protein Pla52o_33160 [Novipirellula galeiformis]|uniref:Uncharacterized protein n=1 Tax=Novipirellula galeiformis TaxID=2528004 RepID=A0A5C6CCD3_9BACT|nr:hypothetical protein Pla52o_33160 [Novipirellula galeiformis]